MVKLFKVVQRAAELGYETGHVHYEGSDFAEAGRVSRRFTRTIIEEYRNGKLFGTYDDDGCEL